MSQPLTSKPNGTNWLMAAQLRGSSLWNKIYLGESYPEQSKREPGCELTFKYCG